MKKACVCLLALILAASIAEAKEPEPLLNKRGDMLVGHINMNEATTAQLVELPSIGPVLAERIVNARQKKAFRRVDDLLRIEGFGRKRLSKLRAHLRTEGPTTLRWQAREPEVTTPETKAPPQELPTPPPPSPI